MTKKDVTLRNDLFFLCFPAFLCCWGLDVSIPKQEYTVKKGEDVELICNFKPAVAIANNFLLTWDAYPDVTGAPLVRCEYIDIFKSQSF